jgi:biotin-dependent carboxylase-like uncharacterized protein
MIEVVQAPPHATIQDRGFPRGRAWGVPPAGAMDPLALFAGNGLVGNPPDAAVIEWALGPLVIRCERETVLAALPVAEARINGVLAAAAGSVTVPAGGELTLAPDPRSRFGYLAVRGGLEVPPVLGSRSTCLSGGFGGFAGRRLRPGDRLRLGGLPATGVPERAREIAARLRAEAGKAPVLRVTRGPQWNRFDAAMQQRFLASQFRVDRASDRSGYRLSGPAVNPIALATLPSEAACPGAVQVPDNGQPIVLMPDGPTVGGYPKIAVVCRWDLARLAQCQPGAEIRFREISLEEARTALEAERPASGF